MKITEEEARKISDAIKANLDKKDYGDKEYIENQIMLKFLEDAEIDYR